MQQADFGDEGNRASRTGDEVQNVRKSGMHHYFSHPAEWIRLALGHERNGLE